MLVPVDCRRGRLGQFLVSSRQGLIVDWQIPVGGKVLHVLAQSNIDDQGHIGGQKSRGQQGISTSTSTILLGRVTIVPLQQCFKVGIAKASGGGGGDGGSQHCLRRHKG